MPELVNRARRVANMKKVLTITLAPLLLSLLVACSTQPIVDDSHPFFPTQKNVNDMMTARTEGILIVDNGYLRLKSILSENSSLLIWPYGFSLDMEGDDIKILDKEGEEVARVGDVVNMGGGDVPKEYAEDFMGRKLPDGAKGPFWVVGEVVSSVPAPEPVPPLTGKDVFRSDKYHFAVRVPPNWGKAEGPETIARPFTGQAAFNSWGEAGFWSHEVRTENRSSYGGDTIMSQIPQNGAYVVLIEISGGPPPSISSPPAEYTSNNLSALLKPQDWRLGPASNPGYHAFNFYKWGTGYFLQIVCGYNASDSTVAEITGILESWQFDGTAAGNTGWAYTVARQLLPASALPFPDRSGDYGGRQTEATVGPDNTVHFRFTYPWTSPTGTLQHWWKIDVLPDGKAILVSQGGDPLPK